MRHAPAITLDKNLTWFDRWRGGERSEEEGSQDD